RGRATVPLLRGERVAQVSRGEKARLDEQPTERTPGRRRGGGRPLELAGRVEVDAVLLREHARERPAAHIAVVDEDLAEWASATRLLGKRVLELLLGQQPFVRKQRPEGTPRKARLVHRLRDCRSCGTRGQS